MRYIADENGYLLEVSFGADIVCGDNTCTEYTGSVPADYTSLEAWYLSESDKLYRWRVVDGELSLDSSAAAPIEGVGLNFMAVYCSANTSLTPTLSKIPCGSIYAQGGTLLEACDGGIKCHKSGVLLVSTTLTSMDLTAGDGLSVAPYVRQVFSQTYAQSGQRVYVSATNIRPANVEAGDVVYLYGANPTGARGSIAANSRTLLFVMYLN